MKTKIIIFVLLCCGLVFSEERGGSNKDAIVNLEAKLQGELSRFCKENNMFVIMNNVRDLSYKKLKQYLIENGVKDGEQINDVLNAVSCYRYLTAKDKDFILEYYDNIAEIPNIYIDYALDDLKFDSHEEAEFWCKLAITDIKSNPEMFRYMCIKLLSRHSDIRDVKDFLIMLPLDINSSMYFYRELSTQDKGDMGSFKSIHEWYLTDVIRANDLEEELSAKISESKEYLEYVEIVAKNEKSIP